VKLFSQPVTPPSINQVMTVIIPPTLLTNQVLKPALDQSTGIVWNDALFYAAIITPVFFPLTMAWAPHAPSAGFSWKQWILVIVLYLVIAVFVSEVMRAILIQAPRR
jgi:hypothetical protein